MSTENEFHLFYASEDWGINEATFPTEDALYEAFVRDEDEEGNEKGEHTDLLEPGAEWYIVHGTRYELDMDRLARMQKAIDDADEEQAKRALEAQERAAYERLKAKYEP